jgi:hypothetical protein
MDQKPNTPPPMSISVTVNGVEREIFMPFALLNRLSHMLGDIQNLGMVHLNPEVRETFLVELLHERGPGGKVTKEAILDELEIPLQDIERLLDFTAEHILDFTLRVIERATTLQEKNQARMLHLKSIQAGLENSTSKS